MPVHNFPGFGTATYDAYDPDDWVAVGDRWVPRRIDVYSSLPKKPDFKMTIEVRQGVPVCVEVTVQARPDGRDVRKRDLDVPLDEWVDSIVAACSAVGDVDEAGRLKRIRKPASNRHAAMANARRARSGRPRMEPQRLQEAADIYRAHVANRPNVAIMRAFGVSERTAARYVELARKAGLLPPTTPGKKKA
ncbi:DUF6214 family protein [Mycobacterium camsae]|uniref:DUF6214 family protein n=1 Tax=Mycobacterium gordonae TaxID=1778 RepID=UPI0019811347|nr:DUF6214 family protein [Mycobacterium gordonae]